MNKPTFVLFRPKIFHETAERFYIILKRILQELSLEWIDVFTRDTYCQIVVDSLNHCITKKALLFTRGL